MLSEDLTSLISVQQHHHLSFTCSIKCNASFSIFCINNPHAFLPLSVHNFKTINTTFFKNFENFINFKNSWIFICSWLSHFFFWCSILYKYYTCLILSEKLLNNCVRVCLRATLAPGTCLLSALPNSTNSPAFPGLQRPKASYVINSFAEKQSCNSTTSTSSGLIVVLLNNLSAASLRMWSVGQWPSPFQQFQLLDPEGFMPFLFIYSKAAFPKSCAVIGAPSKPTKSPISVTCLSIGFQIMIQIPFFQNQYNYHIHIPHMLDPLFIRLPFVGNQSHLYDQNTTQILTTKYTTFSKNNNFLHSSDETSKLRPGIKISIPHSQPDIIYVPGANAILYTKIRSTGSCPSRGGYNQT
ncbi:hypothetical protein AGLY_009272 [Aphis glycines]|uniref:Uncharacterized protein n=1 Tax=Aphis glycines TaxID=307491 RepID=A0A6G0TKE9_APHGL|nr:hypothetical protein AGLY_009272 [Aphis glycines]